MDKTKKEFRARIKLVDEYKNKGFYYTPKVKEDGIIVDIKSRILDQPLCKKKYSSLESRLTSPYFVRFRLTQLLAPHIFFYNSFSFTPPSFLSSLLLTSSFILREIKRNVVNLESYFLYLLNIP